MLDKAIGPRRTPKVSEDQMHRLVQTKAVAYMVVQSVLSDTGIIIPIAETIGKMVDWPVHDDCLRNVKYASTIVADTDQLIERSPPVRKSDWKYRPTLSQRVVLS